MIARSNNAGFSLVEVMCAILILGLAMVGLTLGITTALTSNKESELQTAAALIAAGQMEQLQADRILVDGVEEGDCGAGLALYRWRQSISSTSISGLHEVAVTVENTRTGKPIYELRTLLFDPPAEKSSGSNRERTAAGRAKRRDGGSR